MINNSWGPDDSENGYQQYKNGLGHLRLSIIDLKSGSQPMMCRKIDM